MKILLQFGLVKKTDPTSIKKKKNAKKNTPFQCPEIRTTNKKVNATECMVSCQVVNSVVKNLTPKLHA